MTESEGNSSFLLVQSDPSRPSPQCRASRVSRAVDRTEPLLKPEDQTWNKRYDHKIINGEKSKKSTNTKRQQPVSASQMWSCQTFLCFATRPNTFGSRLQVDSIQTPEVVTSGVSDSKHSTTIHWEKPADELMLRCKQRGSRGRCWSTLVQTETSGPPHIMFRQSRSPEDEPHRLLPGALQLP